MKTALARSLAGLTAALTFAAAALVAVRAAPVPAASPPLQRKIDALLQRRAHPEPLPITLPNPFQVNTGLRRDDLAPGTGPEAPAAASPASGPEGEATDIEVLTAVAGRLKVGGVIVLKDRLQVVVNGTPRKEGDVIAADWNATLIHVRIARLLPGQLVLRYGKAEVTLKF